MYSFKNNLYTINRFKITGVRITVCTNSINRVNQPLHKKTVSVRRKKNTKTMKSPEPNRILSTTWAENIIGFFPL